MNNTELFKQITEKIIHRLHHPVQEWSHAYDSHDNFSRPLGGLMRKSSFELNPIAEHIVKRTNAEIHFTAEPVIAEYGFCRDSIIIPHHNNFKTSTGYYSTMFHELGHWTGHWDRLNRDPGPNHGGPLRAVEEMTAEMTSALICGTIGIDDTERHASYIANHYEGVGDLRALVLATQQAQEAATFILERAK